MKVLNQLLKEFGIPLLAALLWATYNVHEQATPTAPVAQAAQAGSLRVFLNTFGPTFFFVSWLFSQWYRVRKQQRVEDGLVGIEIQVRKLLVDLEAKTNDLVAHITGGDSVCYLVGSPMGSDHVGQLAVVHIGKHPLYGVHVRIVDVEAFDKIKDNMTYENIQTTEVSRAIGDLAPGHAVMVNQGLPLGTGDRRHFNIFFSARNGSFVQHLQYRRVNGIWLFAVKVDSRTTHFENVQDGFPGKETGEIDWNSD